MGKRGDSCFAGLCPQLSQDNSSAGSMAVRGKEINARAGSVLWEWCKEINARATDSHMLPSDAWGQYSGDVNDDIEQAFQANEKGRVIEVGIRSYELVFGPEPGFARQTDTVHKKRRLVRRRVVLHDEGTIFLHQGGNDDREEDMCAMCMETFHENAHLPVVVLPDCGHAFHAACSKLLADDKRPCPLCRREVDWRTLFPRPTRERVRGKGRGKGQGKGRGRGKGTG